MTGAPATTTRKDGKDGWRSNPPVFFLFDYITLIIYTSVKYS